MVQALLNTKASGGRSQTGSLAFCTSLSARKTSLDATFGDAAACLRVAIDVSTEVATSHGVPLQPNSFRNVLTNHTLLPRGRTCLKDKNQSRSLYHERFTTMPYGMHVNISLAMVNICGTAFAKLCDVIMKVHLLLLCT